jgi:cephalosporin-C deacetylase-like acetyl esterase
MLLLIVLLGCGGSAKPTPAAPSSPAAPPRPPDFSYAATAPLDVQLVGTPDRWGDVTISQLTYASPRGGRVPALLVAPANPAGRLPAVILQHGMGAVDKSNLLPDAVVLARAGAIALLPDAPNQRPAALRVLEFAGHDHDPELWEQAAIDLRRAVDVLVARDDVDPQRIGYVGHSFGATLGAILAAVEPRIRALVLVAPGAYTTTIREGQTEDLIALRKNVPPRALAGYLATMELLDAPRWIAQAPKTTTVLLQFAAYDPGVPPRAVEAMITGSTATTETRRYPTGHFITSPSALRDRVAFLGRLLQLTGAGDAMTRELATDTTTR